MASESSSALHGGKLIAEGSYGCVFDPPLACVSGIEKKFKGHQLGKLTTRSEAEKEMYISNVLKTIPHIEKYFAVITTECNVKPRGKQQEGDFDNCEILQTKPYSKFVQIITPYAGQAIHFFNKQIRAGAIDFYKFGTHLLEGTSLLLLRGLVHYDLHKANILVNNPNEPKIIDFGFSWRVSFLPTIAEDLLYYMFEPEHSQYAPELHIPGRFKSTDNINVNVLRTILSKKNVSRKLELTLGVPFEQSVAEYKDFIYNSRTIQGQDWLKFYQTYWPKFDAWSVGRVLLDIYQIISTVRGYKPTEKDAIYSQVIRGLCTPSPKKRLTAAEALKLWNPDSPILAQLKGWTA